MREPLKDKNSCLIGYTQDQANGEIAVLDKNSRLLGYVKEDGTYDKNNHLVSRSQLPGLLIEE